MTRRYTQVHKPATKLKQDKPEKSIVDSYNAWSDSLLKSIGIKPKLVVGLDEFFTVLMCLFYVTLFFFRSVAPTVVQESNIPSVPPFPSTGGIANVTNFLVELKQQNAHYADCFTVESVPTVSYMDSTRDSRLGVYNGHFTPVHRYIFNDQVGLASSSAATPDVLIAVPTKRGLTTESLRITMAATVDSICTAKKKGYLANSTVVLGVGCSYAAIEDAFIKKHGKEALKEVRSVHIEAGTGWSNLQLTDLYAVTGGQVNRLRAKAIPGCKACKQSVATGLYEWVFYMLQKGAYIGYTAFSGKNGQKDVMKSLLYDSDDSRKIVATFATTGGFRGPEVSVPPAYHWKNSTEEFGAFDGILAGSGAKRLAVHVTDAVASVVRAFPRGVVANESTRLPLLLLTAGHIYLPLAVIGTASVLVLVTAIHIKKTYHRKSGRITVVRLILGIFIRLLTVALTSAAGYVLAEFYPGLARSYRTLNFVTGFHRAIICAAVLFVTGASIILWGLMPLLSIPVTIIENAFFLVLLQPVLLSFSRFAPEIAIMSPLLLQLALCACVAQLLSDIVRKRFAIKYPSVIYGIVLIGAIVLPFPTVYYNLYMLLNNVTHLYPVWTLSDDDIKYSVVTIIAVFAVLLSLAFGHVGALLRRAPLRFAVGVFLCAVSFVPMYYYSLRIPNDHVIKNLKHIPGVSSLPMHSAHTDITFWCFDDEAACSVDVSTGLYDHVDIYNTMDEEGVRDKHNISLFSNYVNVTIPTVTSKSVKCTTSGCTSSKQGTAIVVIANTLERRHYYSSDSGSVKNIIGGVSHVCEQVPVQVEEAVYWRRTYKAYSCYIP